MITAHPFDLSGGRVQAGIKKVPALPGYRHIIPADSEAQGLASTRGRMLSAATKMGPKGLPNAEFNPAKDNFPCGYCGWKTRCQVVQWADSLEELI